MKTTADHLMKMNHYPGSSCPAMGEAVRSRMPRQKAKRSFKGGKSGNPNYGNYNPRADEG